MIQVLKGLPGVKCLVNDILVIGRNQIEHDERLRAVLHGSSSGRRHYPELWKLCILCVQVWLPWTDY